MDFSEKDSARSKYRLTQKRSRGRGSGGAAAQGAATGRGGKGAPAGRPRRSGHLTHDLLQLDSNHDRYEEEAETPADASGPAARKSKGADLAELLANADCLDPGRHWRFRALQSELEFEAAKHVDTNHEGLSLDLRSLDSCLALLPIHEVLNIEPEYVYADDTLEDIRSESEKGYADWHLATDETLQTDEAKTAPSAQPAAAAPGSDYTTGSSGHPTEQRAHTKESAEGSSPVTTAHSGAAAAQDTALPRASSAVKPTTAPVPDESDLDYLLSGGPTVQSQKNASTSETLPDELDSLLQISSSTKSGAAPVARPAAGSGPLGGQSIEDWLDSL
mmetsp:Transcript_39624/g.71051  ORF Transcript_39624/g.71051 Transcript_39624/m.71051 type:complete len:333 (-) Transcript_39624:1240-2238(-)